MNSNQSQSDARAQPQSPTQLDRPPQTVNSREKSRSAAREEIEAWQFSKLRKLLDHVLPENVFYQQKLAAALDQVNDFSWLTDRKALSRLPLTLKSELNRADSPFASNLTWPVDAYARFHRTSGTHGHPVVVLDTKEDWNWWVEGWQYVLDTADVDQTDRAAMAFSFGPFIGFWSAFDAAAARGALVVPMGAMTTLARLDLIQSTSATVVFCTPSYALHMAEVAKDNGIAIQDNSVKKIIVAGEPGGSIQSIKQRIERDWNAHVFDHAGASEIGPWGFADLDRTGLYVNEFHFLPELITLDDGELIPFERVPLRSEMSAKLGGSPSSGLAELVLTTLGRAGSPVVRYPTGDLVRPVINDQSSDGCRFLFLDGGVLGRTDDMMIIRGVNVFPASVEAIVRENPDVVEYRMTAEKAGQMDQLKIEVEATSAVADTIGQLLNTRLGLRVAVTHVPDGTLPRFEAKGKRFIDLRGKST